MILPLGGLLLGALIGIFRAKAKDGTSLDMLQWGAVFALIFGLIGLFVLIMIERAYV